MERSPYGGQAQMDLRHTANFKKLQNFSVACSAGTSVGCAHNEVNDAVAAIVPNANIEADLGTNQECLDHAGSRQASLIQRPAVSFRNGRPNADESLHPGGHVAPEDSHGEHSGFVVNIP